MRSSFSRSLLALDSDRFGGTLAVIVVGLLLFVAWTAWFLFARVALYEVGEARLEVGQEPHALMSLVSGQVTRSDMELDAEVDEGAALIELDASDVGFRLAETRAEREGRQAEADAIAREIAAIQGRVDTIPDVNEKQRQQAQAELESAEADLRQAEDELERGRSVHEDGLISRQELDRLETRAERAGSEAEARRRALESLVGRSSLDRNEAEADLSALQGDRAEILANLERLEAVEGRLARELSRHTIRAPVAGRIGELSGVRVGEVVEVGQHLGSVVPSGDVRVVAEFAPHRALGRIRPSQPARLRLQGFSWVQYGSVPATVTRVGSEPQDGRIRVELSLDDPESFPVPLSHGLPGTLQVEVERISPASLVLRAAGDTLSGPVALESR